MSKTPSPETRTQQILDDDLKSRRLGVRADPTSGELYIKRTWEEDPNSKKKKQNEFDFDNEEEFIEEAENEEEEEGAELKRKFVDPVRLLHAIGIVGFVNL